MKRWMLSFAIGIGVFGMVTHAHHSIAAVYDSSQQVTIEGVVTRVEFVNPHPLVTIDVQGGSGTAPQWLLEMDTHRELDLIRVPTGRRGARVPANSAKEER